MRVDSMAEKFLGNDVTGFGKEVRALVTVSTSLPCTVEGVSGAGKIAELWKQHYSELFNCVKSDLYKVGNVANSDTVGITCREVVQQAITQLADNKASGLDRITAEHLQFASPRAAALLAICYTGFMTHGLLAHSMLSVTLVAVIKDEAGKVRSLDNYRPIALASVLCKVLERIT